LTRAAIFDLDGTLLDCNSGRLWLEHEWRGGRVSSRDAVWAAWVLVQYHLGRADLAHAYEAAAATLVGGGEAELADRTVAWFGQHVRHRLRPGAMQALATHRERGDRLVLATSSTIYAAREAAVAYRLDDCVATRLEVADGRFTGKVAASAFGDAKAERLREWSAVSGIGLADCTFYTDSTSDLALLEAVGEAVCVNPDRRLARTATDRGWAVVDWGRQE
jgi:HAD superfamily hydrolase (TIGR01490 family)